MKRIAAALSVMSLTVGPAAAQPLVCFGNEPSWSMDLTVPDRARLDSTPIDYTGRATVNAALRERVWRGRASTSGGDLVVFVREGACSDGMSDTTHPVSARASTPDGAFLAGCCRVPAAQAGAPGVHSTAFEGTAWRLVTLPGQPPATIAALRRGITIRFESGRVSGFSGCNTFSGPFMLNQNRVTLGVLAGTMMACTEPDIGRFEDAFKTALAGPLSYAIAGVRLTLTTDSGAVLTFEKEAPVALEGGMLHLHRADGERVLTAGRR